jgi:UDP-N-acetylmuramate dehydrogenase
MMLATHKDNILPLPFNQNVSLADKNWFKTGGPARWYHQPTTLEAFQTALRIAAGHQWPLFILGQGANVLISDEGFDGLVIHPALTSLRIVAEEPEYAYVEAGAGLTMASLIDYCLAHQLLGLEEFSGIPGTVGGAVFINIHYFEFLLSMFLTSGTIISRATGEIHTVDHSWFMFGYNYSKLHEEYYYLTSATFKLRKATALEAAHAQGRKQEIIRHRERKYPRERTCGSFFRNLHAHELPLKGPAVPFIAYYFDQLGIKGTLSIGGASVSHKHANMIVTNEKATSQDVISLARCMQQRVHDRFGILPQPECRFVGFREDPLTNNIVSTGRLSGAPLPRD